MKNAYLLIMQFKNFGALLKREDDPLVDLHWHGENHPVGQHGV